MIRFYKDNQEIIISKVDCKNDFCKKFHYTVNGKIYCFINVLIEAENTKIIDIKKINNEYYWLLKDGKQLKINHNKDSKLQNYILETFLNKECIYYKNIVYYSN